MDLRDTVRELDKILDVMMIARNHHCARDEANAKLHMASTVRYSPLTTALYGAVSSITELRNRINEEDLNGADSS